MHRLESLEDEGVTRRGGFNAVGKGCVDEINKERQRQEGHVGVIRIVCREEVGSAGEGVGAGEEFSRDMDHL